MIFRFMDAHRERWAVGKMAKAFGVSSSGYYVLRRRKPSGRACSDLALVAKIREILKRHRQRSGSPRVHEELAAMGTTVGRNRVALLMRLHDLSCRPRKRFQVTTDSRHHEPVAEDILDRKLDVAETNSVWVSDITYLPTKEGWLYLCLVIDLFDPWATSFSTLTVVSSTAHRRSAKLLWRLCLCWLEAWARKGIAGTTHARSPFYSAGK